MNVQDFAKMTESKEAGYLAWAQNYQILAACTRRFLEAVIVRKMISFILTPALVLASASASSTRHGAKIPRNNQRGSTTAHSSAA